ncbi:MAG: hypothetical protein BYD32DRAFT_311949 [Podila humilis]|nr:MAG: hypothetical protein BYD32DRAFT_311949 [Podila humilis]
MGAKVAMREREICVSLEEGSSNHGNKGNGTSGLQGSGCAVLGGGSGSRGRGGAGSGQLSRGVAGGDTGDSDVQGAGGPGLGHGGLAHRVVLANKLDPVVDKLGGVEGSNAGHQVLGQVVDSALDSNLGALRADISSIQAADKEGVLGGTDRSRGQVGAQLRDKAVGVVGNLVGQAVGWGGDLGSRQLRSGSTSGDVLGGGGRQGGGGAGRLGADAVDDVLVVGGGASADQGGVVDLLGVALLVLTGGGGRVVVEEERSAGGILGSGDRGASNDGGDGGSDGETHCDYVDVINEG